jgi:hypothetical protein
MGHIMPSTFILTFIPSAAKSGDKNRATMRRLKNKNRTLLSDLISTSHFYFLLASYLSNLQQNNFSNVYLAKTPRRREKYPPISPNLASFAPLREPSFMFA